MSRSHLANLFVILLLLLSTACATAVHKAFPQVKVGDDKASTVELLGNPKHTVRRDGKDFWVYRYYRDGIEFRRTLVFEAGKLESIGAEERIADPREELIEQQLESMPTGAPASKFIEQ